MDVYENISDESITLTLANHIYMKLSDIPGLLAARIKRMASFSNPVFFKTQALRFSTYGIPRYISCARIEQGYLSVPRSCFDELQAMRVKERRAVESQLHEAQVIVATGKYIGEGFDLPRLDTLFLALPIAWKGTLSQYAGRIHRDADGKQEVTVYDYLDASLPMLERMFFRPASEVAREALRVSRSWLLVHRHDDGRPITQPRAEYSARTPAYSPKPLRV